jgi:hypothetical protein
MKSNTRTEEEKMTTYILRKYAVCAGVVVLMFSFCGECLAERREPIVRSDAEYPATPEKVVEEYVRKDAEGARLSGVKFREIRDLFMWEEAGFDVATIITGYNVKILDVGPEIASISVTYQELGEFSPFKFRPDKKDVTEVFLLKKVGSRWRITAPEIFPHVSLDGMISMFKRYVEIDPRDNDFVRMLKELENLKEREGTYAD